MHLEKGFMMDFSKIMDRIAIILERERETKVFDKDIAKALDMSSTQYSNAKKRNSIPYQKIAEFCASNRININWVLYEQSTDMLKTDSEYGIKVKLFGDVNASAGGGAFNDDENYTYFSIDPAYAKLLNITDNDKIDAITVTGESMEPTLKDGSIILIDRNKTDITNGSIFVINAGGTVYIKRLMMNPNGNIDMISDNSMMPIQEAHIEESVVIGRVIGALERI